MMWRIGSIRMKSIRRVKGAGTDIVPIESYANIRKPAGDERPAIGGTSLELC
jgi:hypothetical protein